MSFTCQPNQSIKCLSGVFIHTVVQLSSAGLVHKHTSRSGLKCAHKLDTLVVVIVLGSDSSCIRASSATY